MANHKSAAKRARQTIKRTEANRFYRTRLKNITKAVRQEAANGDKAAAQEALKVALSDNLPIIKTEIKSVLSKL